MDLMEAGKAAVVPPVSDKCFHERNGIRSSEDAILAQLSQ